MFECRHTHIYIDIIFVKHVDKLAVWIHPRQSQAVSAMKRSRKRFEELNFSDNHVGDEGWVFCAATSRFAAAVDLKFLQKNLRPPKVTGAECLKDGLKNSLTLKRGPAELSLQMWVMVVSIYHPVMKYRNQKLSITVSYLSLLLHLHY